MLRAFKQSTPTFSIRFFSFYDTSIAPLGLGIWDIVFLYTYRPAGAKKAMGQNRNDVHVLRNLTKKIGHAIVITIQR